jgi:hypothetical protein
VSLLTTRPGGIVRKDDVAIAKNYLTDEELQVLNYDRELHLATGPRSDLIGVRCAFDQ